MKSLYLALAFFGALNQGWGRSISEKQNENEIRLIRAVSQSFRFHQITHSGILPTNWTMLNEWFSSEAWHEKELQFREFGEDKGFTNSIFQKYVFVTPPARMASYKDFTGYTGPVSPSEPADILFMSAIPLQEGTNVYRQAVLLSGTNIFERGILEARVQKSFALAGRAIPTASPVVSGNSPVERKENPEDRPNQELSAQSQKERRESLEGKMESSQKIAATNEIVAMTPSSQPKSWWPVLLMIGIGTVLLLLLKRRHEGK